MVDVVKLGIKRPATKPLLPDPEPREVNYTLFSVDDHLMEPPHTFEGRLPSRFEDDAPRVIETDEGHEVWMMEGTPYFQVGFMAVAGRPKEDHRVEPSRFSEVRRGCWDIHARIKDMDIGGIHASVNFPSGVTGFGGTLFWRRCECIRCICVRLQHELPIGPDFSSGELGETHLPAA